MNASETKIAEGRRNRMSVWLHYRANPCSTKGECATALGLTPKTVSGHVAAIRAGWRPDFGEADAENFLQFVPVVDGFPRLHIGSFRAPLKADWTALDPGQYKPFQRLVAQALCDLCEANQHG